MPSPSRHDPSRPAIAVLGTGRMGRADRPRPACGRLRGVGMEPHRRGAAPLAADGARLSSSPAGAAEGAHSVLTMLVDGDAVNDAMTGREGALTSLRPGSAWIQMATIGSEWTERLAIRATEKTLTSSTCRSPAATARHGRPADRAGLGRKEPLRNYGRSSTRSVERRSGSDRQEMGPGLKLVLNDWLASLTEGSS